ncbi:MAG TPA: NADP-dependent oxidoreductase, partial [Bryobacteraceae bacterium]|nr:NADP-dependent oxidoreductase [Bryobacteraceae bacterium]
MKAVRLHEYGGPEVLKYEDAPRPEPAAGEILVKVHAAAVNPVDWKVRAGHLKGFLNYQLPLIPGWDLSGVVQAAGPGVTAWKNGDEVYSRPDISRNGAYAEYIAVKATEVARKPKSLDHTQAAAIPLAALTAWQALFDAGGLQAGQRVLIHAAAGGVGTFAVQLARWKGAHVLGTASERNHAFLRQLGADETIDYSKVRFEDVVHDVDLVLDAMAGETRDRSWKVIRKGGILVTILGQPSAEDAAKHGVRAAGVFVQPNQAELDQISGLVDSGKLKPIIEAVLPLQDA